MASMACFSTGSDSYTKGYHIGSLVTMDGQSYRHNHRCVIIAVGSLALSSGAIWPSQAGNNLSLFRAFFFFFFFGKCQLHPLVLSIPTLCNYWPTVSDTTNPTKKRVFILRKSAPKTVDLFTPPSQ